MNAATVLADRFEHYDRLPTGDRHRLDADRLVPIAELRRFVNNERLSNGLPPLGVSRPLDGTIRVSVGLSFGAVS